MIEWVYILYNYQLISYPISIHDVNLSLTFMLRNKLKFSQHLLLW